MTSLRLDQETDSRLSHLAQTTGRTKSFYIRQLLEEHLDDLEDRYIAEQRLEQPGKRLTSQEMRQALDLEN
jgi:RHH-type rel operon transcriptional repressor/antitoxin RelB